MLLPVHILYFYSISTILIPKFLYHRRFVELILSLLLVSIFAGCLYRWIEILIADPFFYAKLLEIKPGFKWQKLQGTIFEQFANKQYLIAAFEQSNTIVWAGLVIKFVQMWYERKQVALDSELNFLKGQIHPHFLFNTLNNLYSLTLDNSPHSPGVVLGLSEILRYMLYECNSEYVPLRRDVEIIQNYIKLEKLRYENRLDVNFNISGDLGQHKIAPLLMIPLVENAFKHGASEMDDGAWVNIDLEISKKGLKFKVSNGKPVRKEQNYKEHFGKIGVRNLRKRLDLIYPEATNFTIYDEEDMYVAILEISLKPEASLKTREAKPFPYLINKFGAIKKQSS